VTNLNDLNRDVNRDRRNREGMTTGTMAAIAIAVLVVLGIVFWASSRSSNYNTGAPTTTSESRTVTPPASSQAPAQTAPRTPAAPAPVPGTPAAPGRPAGQ